MGFLEGFLGGSLAGSASEKAPVRIFSKDKVLRRVLRSGCVIEGA